MPRPYLTLSDIFDAPPPSSVGDEEKIRNLLFGKSMIPYEYADQPGAVHRDMRPSEVDALMTQPEAIQPEIAPQSLLDLAMQPVQSFLESADLSKYLMFLPLLGMVRNAAGKTVPGELVNKKYIPAPASVEREAGKLATLGDLTESEAMKQAAKKLTWQEWERPRLADAYGEMRPAAFDAGKRRMLQNTPSAVDERIQRSLDFLAQPTELWTPKEYGIFDRSLIKDAMEGFPGVEQSTFPRRQPTRADISYMDEIYQNSRNRDLIKKQIERGRGLGGETFYPSLYPVKAEWMSRGGTPEQFNQWVESVAPGSARNSILNENAVGNFLRMLHYEGVPLTDENVKRAMAAFKERYGAGLPLMPVHREGVAKVLEQGVSLRDLVQGDLTDAYKIPTYGAQKAGDFRHSWTGDVHEAAGETLGSRYHPYFTEQGGFGVNEYGPAERYMAGIASEMGGMPLGTAQANRWFGGGEMTGLLSPRGDALDMLETQAAWTLNNMGRPTDPVSVRNYIMGLIEKGGVMLPWQRKSAMPDMREVAAGSSSRTRPGRKTRQ